MKKAVVFSLTVLSLSLLVTSLMSSSVNASRNEIERHSKPRPTATPKPKTTVTPTVAPAPITAPYDYATDACQGYRCFGGVTLSNGGTSVSPACYNSSEIVVTKCAGTFNLIPPFVPTAGVQYYFVW